MKKQKQLKGQLSIWDSPFKEILEGSPPPIADNGGNEMKNIQVGISGIAENKEFNEALGFKTKTIRRKKLATLIKYKLNTNKIGFAHMLKIAPATVTKWLYTNTEPSIEMMKRIAHHLGMSLEEVDELFEVA